MDNELIERARELAGAATPGEWACGKSSKYIPLYWVKGRGWYELLNEDNAENNGAFIAASRELVPALCDALEAAQVQVTDLRGEIEHLKHPFHMEPGKMSDAFINALLASNDEAIRAQKQEIEAAQAENARLREALEEIKRIHAQTWRYDTPIKTIEVLDKMVNIAYAALEPRP